ncbi:MAG: hypothetical protein ACM3ZB_09145 [bacterium]|jgi:Na+-transporting methylmalonyl-CoA/oxaloacetate decarboxylase gamma subunit
MIRPELFMALSTAMLFACLVLLVALMRGARRAAASLEDERTETDARIETLKLRLSDAESRLAELEEDAGVLVPPEPPRSGMNLARRSEALRRLRKGESPANIAASMGIALGELELLAKVQKMLLAADRGAAPRPARSTTAPAARAPLPVVQADLPVEPEEQPVS